MTSDNDKITFTPALPRCNGCGVLVGFYGGTLVHMAPNGTIDQAREEDHKAVIGMIGPNPVADPLYVALHGALDQALAQEEYAMASKVCELLDQITRKVNRERWISTERQ